MPLPHLLPFTDTEPDAFSTVALNTKAEDSRYSTRELARSGRYPRAAPEAQS